MQSNFTIEPYDRHRMKWSRWVERLEGAFLLFRVPADLRRPMLLHYMGGENYDIVSDKLAPVKPQARTYDEIVQLLETHFNPRPLEILENFRFKCRRQGDERVDESIDDYLIALRKLAITCNFGDYLNTALRNQFVFGLKDRGIQARLLEVHNLTLDMARDLAVSMEMSAKGGQEIQSRAKADVNLVEHPVNKSGKSKGKKPGKAAAAGPSHHGDSKQDSRKGACYRCGNTNHFANKCVHVKTVCNFCRMTGHIEKVCMKKKSAQGTKSKSDFHLVEESAAECKQKKKEDVYIDEICGLYDAESRVDKFWVEISVNDSKVRFEVDSGAPVAIMSVTDYEKLLPAVRLDPPDMSLVSYSGNTIKLRGMCTVSVQYAGKVHRLLLYVADNRKHPLLGRSWMKVLRLDVSKFYDEVHSVVDNSVKCTTDESVKKLIARYSSVCADSMGKIIGLTAKLRLKPNAHPVYIKARPVPFSLRSAVEQEIEKLVDEGVLEKVNHSDWATPVVPVMKLNNKVRLCGDYKITVNPNLVVDEHPLPTIEELFANVAGGEKFSKIDLSQAYLQLEVDPDQREILTLSTHLGLYRPTRLMYGVSSAPAIWQRLMEEVLNGIPGVTVFLDDIRVTGPTNEVHLQRLEEVLKRLSQYGMRINLDKCVFFADEIEYCGYVVDRHGIHKVQKKIEAVQNMPTPENKDQVRSFVGLVNYYGRFLPNLSTMIYPLNRLLRNDVPFQWSKSCEEAFRKVKQEMQSDSFLVHYNPELPLVLATDASPYGVGAVLSHVLPDGSERPIQYASQTFNETQRKYKQVDREAYAIVFGIRRFHQYLYGRKFVLYTDNEPHCNADAFSRLPIATKQPDNVVEEVDMLETCIIETMPVTVEDLAKGTAADGSVKLLLQGLRNGKTVEAKDRFGIDQNEFSLQQGWNIYVCESSCYFIESRTSLGAGPGTPSGIERSDYRSCYEYAKRRIVSANPEEINPCGKTA
nr:uncharacterized protein K02A2.6-like [Aedes albopictus]